MRKLAITLLAVGFTLALSQAGQTEGKWEVGLHYGSWSVNLLESYFEDIAAGIIEDEIMETIMREHPEKSGLDGEYEQYLSLDSTGKNFGAEIRFYPSGKEGSFSLGLSVEKTEVQVNVAGLVTQNLSDGSYFDATGSAILLWEPISYHLSLRWDLLPAAIVHPYLTIGCGLASFAGYVSYEAQTEFYDGVTEEFEFDTASDTVSLDFLENVEPSITPIIVQLNIGLRGRIGENIYVLVDAGIWNGLLIKGGVALRI